MPYSENFMNYVNQLIDQFEKADLTNDKADNGGLTKFGISKKAYPSVDIAKLTRAEAIKIYHDDYWQIIHGDDVYPELAEMLFDYAVNSGAVRAAKLFQRAVGTLQDGKIGPKTLEAYSALVKSSGHRGILRIIFIERCKVYAEHEDYATYKNGWFGRLFDRTYEYAYDTALRDKGLQPSD